MFLILIPSGYICAKCNLLDIQLIVNEMKNSNKEHEARDC